MDEVLRLAVSALIAVSLIGAFAALGRVRSPHRTSPSLELVTRLGLPPGQPAVIYLDYAHEPGRGGTISGSTPTTGAHVIVHRLRAEAEPELMRQLNIATLPATVVIGRDHAIRSVHAGVAEVDRVSEHLG